MEIKLKLTNWLSSNLTYKQSLNRLSFNLIYWLNSTLTY